MQHTKCMKHKCVMICYVTQKKITILVFLNLLICITFILHFSQLLLITHHMLHANAQYCRNDYYKIRMYITRRFLQIYVVLNCFQNYLQSCHLYNHLQFCLTIYIYTVLHQSVLPLYLGTHSKNNSIFFFHKNTRHLLCQKQTFALIFCHKYRGNVHNKFIIINII